MASIVGSSQAPAQQQEQEQGIITVPAKSSWISSFEYDQTNLRLTTHLKSGAIYQHIFFLPINWDQLIQSQDHGSYWTKAVKGKFASVKVKHANHPKPSLKPKHSKEKK